MTDDRGNPMDKARAGIRSSLPKRFYQTSTVGSAGTAFTVLLDERPIRTPGRRPMAVPVRAIAEALAEEWRAQATVIDPSGMPLTRLVNAAIDGVAGNEGAVRADIVKYAGTDLLCYRAEGPATLAARQQAGWDPILAWARDALGAGLLPTTGIAHVVQPPDAIACIATAVEPLPALTLAALHSVTTLTGSALLALACLHRRIEPEETWRLAHIDEDFQIERWGWDAEAKAARGHRWSELQAAALLLTAAHSMP